MARRQIVSLSESSLKLPDDELTLPRMTYFSGHDLSFTSAHRKPASRFGFSVFLCYLRSVDFPIIKIPPIYMLLLKYIASRLKFTGNLWPLLTFPTWLGWEHINLTVDYFWKNSRIPTSCKFRRLRPSNVERIEK